MKIIIQSRSLNFVASLIYYEYVQFYMYWSKILLNFLFHPSLSFDDIDVMTENGRNKFYERRKSRKYLNTDIWDFRHDEY
jgi:hypothetical protein